MPLKIDSWPWKTIGHLSYATSSFLHHFRAIGHFKLELQSRNAKFGSKSAIFFPRVTLKFDRWPCKTIGHLFYAFQAMCMISLPYANSNLSYSPETAKLGIDLCDLDLWPWPFEWTSLLSMVITPENFVMIRWQEHGGKGVTDGQTAAKNTVRGIRIRNLYCPYFTEKHQGTRKYINKDIWIPTHYKQTKTLSENTKQWYKIIEYNVKEKWQWNDFYTLWHIPQAIAAIIHPEDTEPDEGTTAVKQYNRIDYELISHS